MHSNLRETPKFARRSSLDCPYYALTHTLLSLVPSSTWDMRREILDSLRTDARHVDYCRAVGSSATRCAQDPHHTTIHRRTWVYNMVSCTTSRQSHQAVAPVLLHNSVYHVLPGDLCPRACSRRSGRGELARAPIPPRSEISHDGALSCRFIFGPHTNSMSCRDGLETKEPSRCTIPQEIASVAPFPQARSLRFVMHALRKFWAGCSIFVKKPQTCAYFRPVPGNDGTVVFKSRRGLCAIDGNGVLSCDVNVSIGAEFTNVSTLLCSTTMSVLTNKPS